MPLTIDPSLLPPPARKILDGSAPAPLRQMAAKGVAPGLKPGDALTVVALLANGEDAALADVARGTLAKLPAPLLRGALGGPLPAGVLDAIAPSYATDAATMEAILTHPALEAETVERIATKANEAVAELVAVNEERLLAHPSIIEKLYMNEATRMSTADRLLELAVRNGLELRGIAAFKEAAAAIRDELVAEPTPHPLPEDILFEETRRTADALPLAEREDTHRLDEESGDEVLERKFVPLHAKLAEMTTTQKIRRAVVGSAAERSILVRDKHKLVAVAAVRSPKIQESEILVISTNRSVSDEVLRVIATNREWTQSHQVKLNLVTNPRTPFVFSAKLIPFLREHELKALAKSKNVSGAVAQAARQQLQRKGQ